MEEHGQPFDICIVCALAEEARAVVNEFSDRCDNVHFQQAFSNRNGYEYQHAILNNNGGEPLTALIMCMPFTGPVETVNSVRSLLEEFRPRFMAMTGICAGYKEKVALGDLVAASYAFHYEEGKVEADEEGEDRFRPEWRTHGPTKRIVQYINNFAGWETPVAEMKQRMFGRELQQSEQPQCFLAPIASGMAVQGNNPFPRLLEHNRKVLFLDQEVAAFYQTLDEFPDIYFLAVKGVCDYADLNKNDNYREYPARASAIYLLYFIQKYVTNATMPRRDLPPSSDRSGLPPLRGSLSPADKSRYQSWLSAITATFTIPGPSGLSLPIDSAWTELHVLSKKNKTMHLDVGEQLVQYREWEQLASRIDKDGYNAEDVAEIGDHVVIVGGPGVGKSTLCRKLAHNLTDFEELVMWVYLPAIANRIQDGMNINTALVDTATDGFDAPLAVREALLAQADCLIADGLDECGDLVVSVAEALQRWATAHPSIRIVITSRPIGYEIKYFPEWEHYDLMPLTKDQVERSAWELTTALASDATTIEREVKQFHEHLSNNYIASLASRNPLLLGFLIQLSLEGEPLLQQRASLYEQILDLWRVSLPQGRKWQVPQLDAFLAWRSLELVGWYLLSSEKGQTVPSHDTLVQFMSQPLAQEMGIQSHQARVISSTCLQFWHERGVLDRLQIGHKRIYIFVHETFNEYAAGRYLASLNVPEIQQWVRNKYRNVRWREPILLAAGCGAVEVVVETLLESDAEDQQATNALFLAAATLVESPTIPETLTRSVANRLIAYLTSTNPTFVYEVAEQGVSLVKRVPNLFASLLWPLFQHPQQWTRFSAMYLALESKGSIINADELEVFLGILTTEELVPHRRKAVFSSKGNVLFTMGWDLQNKMILLGAETLARLRPDARTRGLLQTLYESSHTISTGVQQELRGVLLALGCDEFIKEQDRQEREKMKKGGIFDLLFSGHQADTDRIVLETILRLTSSPFSSGPKRSKLRALAVLLYTLQLPETPIQDWLVLRRQDDIQAIEAVFSGYMEALHLNKEELAQDAAWALAELQKMNQDGIVGKSLLSLLPKFPVNPEISKRDSLNVQIEDLIRALHHPSVLIAYGAAQLLAAIGGGKEEIASLLFTTNNKRLLHIITLIAGTLWGDEARSLLMKRLDQGYTSGSWWLIEELPSLPGEHTDQQFQQTLLNALQTEEPRITIAAVHALQELDISLLKSMAPALQSALLYWTEQGARAKARSFYIANDCSACSTEPGNACTHVSQLLHRL